MWQTERLCLFERAHLAPPRYHRRLALVLFARFFSTSPCKIRCPNVSPLPQTGKVAPENLAYLVEAFRTEFVLTLFFLRRIAVCGCRRPRNASTGFTPPLGDSTMTLFPTDYTGLRRNAGINRNLGRVPRTVPLMH